MEGEIETLAYLGQLSFFYLTMNMSFYPKVDGTTILKMKDVSGTDHFVSIKHETLCGPSEAAFGKFLEEEKNGTR